MFYLHFVGGTFGVGKSTLCQVLGRLIPGEHLKASELICYASVPNDPTGKVTKHILNNQDCLIEAIDIRRAVGGTVILDGHFCLLDESHAVVRLPINVFRRIDPITLVLVESTVNGVVDRIKRRNGRKIGPDLVKRLLQTEREHSHAIADALDIPILTVNNTTAIEAVVAFLRTATRGS